MIKILKDIFKKIDGCYEEIVLTVLILMCDQVAESDWEFAGMPESELGTQFPSSKLEQGGGGSLFLFPLHPKSMKMQGAVKKT